MKFGGERIGGDKILYRTVQAAEGIAALGTAVTTVIFATQIRNPEALSLGVSAIAEAISTGVLEAGRQTMSATNPSLPRTRRFGRRTPPLGY